MAEKQTATEKEQPVATKEYRYIGDHVGDLEGGRQVEPGEFTGPIDPEAPQNAQLIEEGLLLEGSAPAESEDDKNKEGEES